MISTSAPLGWSVSARPATSASFIARFTARLMLGAHKSGIVSAARRMAACCAASRPVVATTSGTRWATQAATIASVARGTEKSIITSIGTSNSAASGTPNGATPASVPASLPSLGWFACFQRRHDLKLRIGTGQRDQPLAHASGRAVNTDAKGHGEERL